MAYNNYYNPYGMQPSIDRINRQIEDLQNIKSQMQNPPQQQAPVNNFINSNPTSTNANLYELKKLNENDEAENIGIFTDTIFIGNDKMQIKKMDGTIEKFNITKYYPVDPKDQKISQLEDEIKKLKEMISNEPKHDEHITTIQTSTEQGKLHNVDGKSTTKTTNK